MVAAVSVVAGRIAVVPSRWRHAADQPTGRYLSFAEPEEIALLTVQDHWVQEIARRIGRDPSTLSRELRRNAATRSCQPGYRAGVAQWKAQQAAKRPKTAKFVDSNTLREYVQDRLARNVSGRRHGLHRAWHARVEGAEQAAPAGQTMGDDVEPGVDLPSEARCPSGRGGDSAES